VTKAIEQSLAKRPDTTIVTCQLGVVKHSIHQKEKCYTKINAQLFEIINLITIRTPN